MGVAEQLAAIKLAKIAAPGTSNDQQTPPLLAKEPWWSMVVASGGKSGLTGHRSAVREAREPRQIRAIGLTFTEQCGPAKKGAPWRACGSNRRQGNPCSPKRGNSPCGATGATWAAIRALPAAEISMRGGGVL